MTSYIGLALLSCALIGTMVFGSFVNDFIDLNKTNLRQKMTLAADDLQNQLDVMEGDLSKLYEPGGRYIAAVYNKDDYGKWRPDSHWAKVGDQVTLRYVSEFEYYSPTTGEVFGSEPPEKEAYLSRAVEYQEVTYEVAALVAVPSCLGYGYYGADEFVLNDATFCQDTQSDSVMLYAFNTQEGGATAMEDFLAATTDDVRSWQ